MEKSLQNKWVTGTTIFAPATAPGRAGIAVFRISGPHACDAISRLCSGQPLPEPRRAVLRVLRNPATQEILDHALVLWFPAPDSFTGEDIVELHTHGGRAVTEAMMRMLANLPDFRLAEPGEFTRRAFENGRMDLTQAESVADLVHAETEAQRRQALRQMGGALGKLYGGWGEKLKRILAYSEASIDFADDDVPDDLAERHLGEVRQIEREISLHLNDGHRGERLREGLSVAILGPPNAGKSSLLNALAKRDAAIVSATAGTTRDVIEVHLDLGGYPVVLADTAGLRDSNDTIENEGIHRARQRAAEADLKLLVFDGITWPKRDAETLALMDGDTIAIVNKADLVSSDAKTSSDFLFVSAATGEGLPVLIEQLTKNIAQRFGNAGDAPSLTRTRHREALQKCAEHLSRAIAAPADERRAEDVRLALRALGRITGKVGVEDLLDVIFRDFCIGK